MASLSAMRPLNAGDENGFINTMAALTAKGDIRLEWVVVEDKLRHVSDFESLDIDARPKGVCPECAQPVVLKLGKLKAHHAAHYPGSDCALSDGSGSAETAEHAQAKFHLASQLNAIFRIELLDRCSLRLSKKCSDGRRTWLSGWDRAEAERRVGSRRPDVVLYKGDQAIGAIEVYVSHAVDAKKERDLSQLGLPWIEVEWFEIANDANGNRKRWQGEPLRARNESNKPAPHSCQACLTHLAEEQESERERRLFLEELERARHKWKQAAPPEPGWLNVQKGTGSDLVFPSYQRQRVVDVYYAGGRRPHYERFGLSVIYWVQSSVIQRVSLEAVLMCEWHGEARDFAIARERMCRTNKAHEIAFCEGGPNAQSMAVLTEAFKRWIEEIRATDAAKTIIIDKPKLMGSSWVQARYDGSSWPNPPPRFVWTPKAQKWILSERLQEKFADYAYQFERTRRRQMRAEKLHASGRRTG